MRVVSPERAKHQAEQRWYGRRDLIAWNYSRDPVITH